MMAEGEKKNHKWYLPRMQEYSNKRPKSCSRRCGTIIVICIYYLHIPYSQKASLSTLAVVDHLNLGVTIPNQLKQFSIPAVSRYYQQGRSQDFDPGGANLRIWKYPMYN